MEKKTVMPPKRATGKAITYAENQWKSLSVYLTDPCIRLDNNLSENALRIIALGRKAFLFVGHEEAGQNLAVLQAITSTCRLHDVDAYHYIKDVLIRIQIHPASKIDELLPQNWTPNTPILTDSTRQSIANNRCSAERIAKRYAELRISMPGYEGRLMVTVQPAIHCPSARR